MTMYQIPRDRRARSDVFAKSLRGERRYGWFKNIGRAITKGVKDTGHFVGEVASNPITQALTEAALIASGVGAPAAAAIMAAEKGGGALLSPHGNIGDAAKGAAIGGLEGYGGVKLAGLAKGAIGAVTSKVGGAAGDAATGAVNTAANTAANTASSGAADVSGDLGGYGVDGSIADNAATGVVNGATSAGATDIPGQTGTVLSRALNIGKSVGGALVGNGKGGIDAAKAMQILSVAESAAEGKRKQDLENQELKYATDAYNQKAPLRNEGLSMLTNPTPVNFDPAAQSANPYARNFTASGTPLGPRSPLLPVAGSV